MDKNQVHEILDLVIEQSKSLNGEIFIEHWPTGNMIRVEFYPYGGDFSWRFDYSDYMHGDISKHQKGKDPKFIKSHLDFETWKKEISKILRGE